jgi:hypothetical protein
MFLVCSYLDWYEGNDLDFSCIIFLGLCYIPVLNVIILFFMFEIDKKIASFKIEGRKQNG